MLNGMRWAACLLLVPLGMGCGSTPATPTLPAPAALVANVVTAGGLSGECNGTTLQCTIAGTITNVGTGCASQVNGITHLLATSDHRELVAVPWSSPVILRVLETRAYAACCFDYAIGAPLADTRTWTWRVDLAFTTVPCS